MPTLSSRTHAHSTNPARGDRRTKTRDSRKCVAIDECIERYRRRSRVRVRSWGLAGLVERVSGSYWCVIRPSIACLQCVLQMFEDTRAHGAQAAAQARHTCTHLGRMSRMCAYANDDETNTCRRKAKPRNDAAQFVCCQTRVGRIDDDKRCVRTKRAANAASTEYASVCACVRVYAYGCYPLIHHTHTHTLARTRRPSIHPSTFAACNHLLRMLAILVKPILIKRFRACTHACFVCIYVCTERVNSNVPQSDSPPTTPNANNAFRYISRTHSRVGRH